MLVRATDLNSWVALQQPREQDLLKVKVPADALAGLMRPVRMLAGARGADGGAAVSPDELRAEVPQRRRIEERAARAVLVDCN